MSSKRKRLEADKSQDEADAGTPAAVGGSRSSTPRRGHGEEAALTGMRSPGASTFVEVLITSPSKSRTQPSHRPASPTPHRSTTAVAPAPPAPTVHTGTPPRPTSPIPTNQTNGKGKVKAVPTADPSPADLARHQKRLAAQPQPMGPRDIRSLHLGQSSSAASTRPQGGPGTSWTAASAASTPISARSQVRATPVTSASSSHTASSSTPTPRSHLNTAQTPSSRALGPSASRKIIPASRHGPSPLSTPTAGRQLHKPQHFPSGSSSSLGRSFYTAANGDAFSDDDEPTSHSGVRGPSMLERIAQSAEMSGLAQASRALIRPSSSDAYFLSFSPSRAAVSTTTSAASTPAGRGKKRARLANHLDPISGPSPSGSNVGISPSLARKGKGKASSNAATSTAVLSEKVGLIKPAAIRGLFPRRAQGGKPDSSDEEEDGDPDARGRQRDRWKARWGTVSVPSYRAVSKRTSKGRSTYSDEDDDYFVPPFAAHTLHALSTAHFRGDIDRRSRRLRASKGAESTLASTSGPHSRFATWLGQLLAGFSLLFYGVGIGAFEETLPAGPRFLRTLLDPAAQDDGAGGEDGGDRGEDTHTQSSQHILEQFVRDVCTAGHGCAWIGHGLAPSAAGSTSRTGIGGLKIDDVLSGCEDAVRRAWLTPRAGRKDRVGDGDEDSMVELPPLPQGGNMSKTEARAHRLVQLFSGRRRRDANSDSDSTSSSDSDSDEDADEAAGVDEDDSAARRGPPPPALFVLIHSLDAPGLIQPKAQRILTLLGSARHIHLLGTVRNVNAALVVPFGGGNGATAATTSAADVATAGISESGPATEKPASRANGHRTSTRGPDVDMIPSSDAEDDAKSIRTDGDDVLVGKRAKTERNPDPETRPMPAATTATTSTSSVRLRWVWHCISTFVPSLPEALTARHAAVVAGVPAVLDFSGRGGAGASAAALRAHQGGVLASRASDAVAGGLAAAGGVGHVLKSVTTQVRSLFLVLAWAQMRSSMRAGGHQQEYGGGDASTTMAAAAAADSAPVVVSVSRLVGLASKSIMVTDQGRLNALLVELETHGLVRRGSHVSGTGSNGQGGGNNTDWIALALDRSALEGCVRQLQTGELGPVSVEVATLEQLDKE